MDSIQDVLISYTDAISCLNRISQKHHDYAPHVLQLDNVLSITHIVLKTNTYVPITPLPITELKKRPYGLKYPSAYAQTRLKYHMLEMVYEPLLSSLEYWNDFQECCEQLSIKLNQDHTCMNHDKQTMARFVREVVHQHVPRARQSSIYQELCKHVITDEDQHSLLRTLICNQNIFALRSFLRGVLSQHQSKQIYHFPTHHQELEYNSVYRQYQHTLFKTFLQKDDDDYSIVTHSEDYHTQYISEQYRLVPEPFASYLPNARIWNASSIQELIHTNHFTQDVHSLIKNRTFCSIVDLSSCLKKAIYILDQHVFIQPKTSRIPISKEKSVVLLTRYYDVLCSAQTHKQKKDTLHITHIPPFVFAFMQERPLNVIITEPTNNTKHVRQLKTAVKTNQSFNVQMNKPLTLNTSSVYVSLNTKHHRFMYFDLLKQRVGSKMKNVLYENIPSAMQLDAQQHASKTDYILL